MPDEVKAEIRERKHTGGGKTFILGGYVGANMSLFHIGPLHPVVYGTLGVAMSSVFDKGSSDETEHLSYNTVFMQTAGVALPIRYSAGASWQIFGEIVRQDFKGLDTVNGLSFGIRINAPQAVMFKCGK